MKDAHKIKIIFKLILILFLVFPSLISQAEPNVTIQIKSSGGADTNILAQGPVMPYIN